jgi:hypothetical protein
MIQHYFGIIEAVFVFGLALAFYVWQRRSLARDIAKREAREREEAANTANGE